MNSWKKGGIALLVTLALAGCGGGGGGTDTGTVTPAPSSGAVKAALDGAAASPANDTSSNTSSSFTVLQNAGVPAVTVNSPPKVNFAVFSNGKVKTDLALSNVSFAIAKLAPGASGGPDQWVSYVYRKETPTASVGPGGAPVLASAMQATTDAKLTGAAAASQLVFNPDGYYTYTFSTNITDPSKTNGVVFEPNRTHRVAIQLSYTNAAGETVRVNPYFDFTVGADGKSIPVTDPAKTKKVTDVASCNGCHDKLALHGGGRVDTQFCVMCHNPGTTDANSGNVLTLSTMAHKIHAGKRLPALTGEHYTIWGYRDSKHDYSEVGFPQDLRNCHVCHSASKASTPQGDNWKVKASKEACLTCHATTATSKWYTVHQVLNNNQNPLTMADSACAGCHLPGSAVAPERVHFNQNEDHAPFYKMNIESVAYDATARAVTVKYFLSNPLNGNAAYNLVTPDCTGSGATLACANTTKFGNLRLYLAYQNMVGQPLGVTEFSAYNNGGNAANVFAYKGTNDGSNHYTITLPVPADVPGISQAAGSARVVSIGQIKEPKVQAKAATDPRPPVTPTELVNVVVQHTYKDVALSGTLVPRRAVVSNDKCNVCHGALGTTSGSNTLANAFHGGARNTVESCVICHDPNRMSSYTKMTNGLDFGESYQFKRMIHGIHGNSKRTYPFTFRNQVVDSFNKDGTSMTGGAPLAPDVENFAAEVAYPSVGLNCDACHVNSSYKVDRGTLGAVISKPAGVTDPMKWLVISPLAATCTSCHDSPKAIGHVTSYGAASFGNRTQAQSLQTQETCADCHASGGFKGVDIVHGQK